MVGSSRIEQAAKNVERATSMHILTSNLEIKDIEEWRKSFMCIC